MAISKSQLADVCKFGQGELCCSYLMMGPRGWTCAKSPGNEGLKRMLDERRAAGTIRAKGDNCVGWDEDNQMDPAAEYFIAFYTKDCPVGTLDGVRVRIDLVRKTDNDSMRIDLADHPLYEELQAYVKSNPR